MEEIVPGARDIPATREAPLAISTPARDDQLATTAGRGSGCALFRDERRVIDGTPRVPFLESTDVD
jgi:hypothetical protein